VRQTVRGPCYVAALEEASRTIKSYLGRATKLETLHNGFSRSRRVSVQDRRRNDNLCDVIAVEMGRLTRDACR
jgi:hypothetical protein